MTCPGCDKQVELPEGAHAGDTVGCCGTEWRMTYEFGSYALEPAD